MPYIMGALPDHYLFPYIPIIVEGCLWQAIFAVKANERMMDHSSEHWRTNVCSSRNIIVVIKEALYLLRVYCRCIL